MSIMMTSPTIFYHVTNIILYIYVMLLDLIPFVQFKNLKNTHGGVLLLVKLQTSACNFTKSNAPPRVFSRFLNCTNGIKSRNTSHMHFN